MQMKNLNSWVYWSLFYIHFANLKKFKYKISNDFIMLDQDRWRGLDFHHPSTFQLTNRNTDKHLYAHFYIYRRWSGTEHMQEISEWRDKKRGILIMTYITTTELVMGPGQKFLIRVRLGQFFVARVVSGQQSMVWVWICKISPKNVKFFNFFPFGSKKISSGRIKKYPGQRQGTLLFTVVQK